MSIGIRDIERAVCQRFHLTPEQLRGRDVRRKIARPRQIAMYLVRDMTDASLHQVARHFGGRDHTTVIHAARRVVKLIEDGRTMPRYLDEIRAILAAMTPHRETLHQQVEAEELVTIVDETTQGRSNGLAAVLTPRGAEPLTGEGEQRQRANIAGPRASEDRRAQST